MRHVHFHSATVPNRNHLQGRPGVDVDIESLMQHSALLFKGSRFPLQYMLLHIRAREPRDGGGGAVQSPVQEEVLLSKKY